MMIDFQPQMAFAVESIDGQTLVNNATGLAKAAKIFNIPTILTTLREKSFSSQTFAQIRKVFPEHRIGWRDSSNPYFKYLDVTFFTRMYFGYHLCCTNNYRLKTTSLSSSSPSFEMIFLYTEQFQYDIKVHTLPKSSLQYSIDRYH
jgi:hypothetical protein